MARRARWLAVLAVLGALSPFAARGATTPTGSFTKYTFTATGLPTRDYWVYVPAGLPAGAPLVVFLHGCLETATQAASATHFNQLADQEQAAGRGFAVVYPQQLVSAGSSAPLVDGNGEGCWNWFLPDDQHRGAGEPATIAGITGQAINLLGSDRTKVFVEGVSAGADMAVILGATYPDVYASVAALAGCPYATCGDVAGGLSYQAYQATVAQPRVVSMFVEQGTADTLNPFVLGHSLVESWLGNDSLVAKSVMARTPASVEQHGFDQTPQPGSGDACIQPSNWPCPGGVVGFQGTYPYSVEHYGDSNGCDIVDFWIIHGMEHAHPDADPTQPWTDPLGPDVTAASYDFFLRHSESTCVPAS